MTTGFPRPGDLAVATLKALRELGGSGSIQEIATTVIRMESYPDEITSQMHKVGSQTELEYQLAWARTQLRIVGAVQNSARGIWALTSAGWTMPEEIATQVPNEVRKTQGSGVSKASREPDATENGESSEQDADWKSAMLEAILAMSPTSFEHLSRRILREAGFASVTVTGKPADGGIDGHGTYHMSLLSFAVAFQCKRYAGSVGSRAVREFRGSMDGRNSQGIMISTGHFTAEAQKEASRDGVTPIDLIGGDRLCDILKELRLGVTVTPIASELVSVDAEWFADFQ